MIKNENISASTKQVWSIRKRLYFLMIMTLTLLLIGIYFGFQAYKKISLIDSDNYQNIVNGKDLVADILPPPEYIIESYLMALEAITAKNTEKSKKNLDKLQKLEKEYLDRNKYWTVNLEEGELKRILVKESYEPAIEFYKIIKTKFSKALSENNYEEAKKILDEELHFLYEKHRKAIDEIVVSANDNIVEIQSKAEREVNFQKMIMPIIAAMMVISLVLGSILINQKIINELNSVANGLENGLAKGDLTNKFHENKNTEIGRIGSVMNSTTNKLNKMIIDIKMGSSKLGDAASQLSQVSKNLNLQSREGSNDVLNAKNSASGLSLNIETIASAMEEMSASIKEISQRTNSASDIAAQANTEALDISQTIVELNKNSTEISHIVNLINGLAQQTNLLALNATIEASRAGEQGKGFAVVAQEVKDLAFKTANATESISKQIESIQKNIKSTVDKIGVITEMVKQISDNQNLIAAAIEEQTVTSDEIAKNISSVSDQGRNMQSSVHQVNEKISEISKQAQNVLINSETLDQVSHNLHDQVNQFKCMSKI